MADNLPKVTAAALDYATLDADGNPEFVPEAEAAIDRGEKPKAIAKLFRKRRLAKSYIQKSLRRRFSVDALADKCLQCSEPTSGVVTVEWQFRSPLGFFHFALSDSELMTEVQTCHTFCEACAESWFQRQKVPSVIANTGRWLLVASVVAWVLNSLVLSRALRQNYGWMWVFVVALFAVSGIVRACSGSLFRRTWPRCLRDAVPNWCRPNTVIDYCDRSELRDDGAAGKIHSDSRRP